MRIDQQGEPAERDDRADHGLPAHRFKAGERSRQSGQERIGEIGKNCRRHVMVSMALKSQKISPAKMIPTTIDMTRTRAVAAARRPNRNQVGAAD